MSPLAVLTGIIMGSAVTIAIGLAMVVVVFLSLGGEQPDLNREYGHLMTSFGLFFALSMVSSYAFVGVLRERPWRWRAQAGMWLVIAGLVLYYWPRK
jgi:hypothetical protein